MPSTSTLVDSIYTRRVSAGECYPPDLVKSHLKRATPAAKTLSQAKAGDGIDTAGGYGLLTLHRPSNVDDPAVLERLLKVLGEISQTLPLLFPIHPRTRQRIQDAGLQDLLDQANILTLPPQGYLEMLGLMKDARVVLTDSGGIQEETTALGVPCITLRENTERPITVAEGTNTVVGTAPDAIKNSFREVMAQGGKAGRVPEYWDGQAAQRIAVLLREWLNDEATA